MNIKSFILIIAMKVLAIQIIAIGLYCELRTGANIANIFITAGSLIFAIASNTTLFLVYSNTRHKKRSVRKDERYINKIASCDAAIAVK
jgi:hypothetical protein